MKKKCISLLLILLILLPGCTRRGTKLKEPVLFYYPKLEYEYGSANSVIDYEEREASGHTDELPYLLTLYLAGPVEEPLTALFPTDTGLLRAEQIGSTLIVQLSDSARNMTDAEFTLACACLTVTCSELTNASTFTITSGPRSLTLTRDKLLLIDEFRTEEP